MKKYLIIVALLLVIPFGVYAAEPKVLTVVPEVDGSTVKYSGTTEEGVNAVMCKLLVESGEEVDMLSSAVDNKEFSGSFENVEGGAYYVACAKYEGGEVVKEEVLVPVTEPTVEPKPENPNTYNPGIAGSIALLVASATGLAGSIVYIKRSKKKD